jgi:hypothetical protein
MEAVLFSPGKPQAIPIGYFRGFPDKYKLKKEELVS